MIYVLVSEYNDYDQHGYYFIAAFKSYPTKEQLKKHGCDHLGREDDEDKWFEVEETTLE